jgi:heterodisulfide reductase subunit A2
MDERGNSRTPRIGVYLCHCGQNIAPRVDVAEVVRHALSLPGVAVARDYKFMCSEPGQELILKDVTEDGVDRVVVASCSPRMHEDTFRKACAKAGLNPFLFQMANIREGASWVIEDSAQATAKAKSLVAAAVARVAGHRPLSTRRIGVSKTVVVIGGGIAGMQAALTAAESGFKVHLVEREPSIGGHMAKFDKTFPTLDCAACIMTPRMAQVGRHENITLHTFSELESLEGFVGNFKARIRHKPRYVDAAKCTGCGLCAEKCTSRKIPSAFEEGLANRTAIYSPFPQAVPKVPVIDTDHCRFVQGRTKVAVCQKLCPAGAIDFSQQATTTEVEAGAVILATGFKAFDPTVLSQYGYGRLPEVYTSLQFERLNNATGPTAGKILTKDGRVPGRVAIIHCVGSRDKRHRVSCSRVCCMYSMKFAHLVREKTGAEVFEFYIDIRSPGKNYEEFYNRVQAEGVHFIRGRVAEVTDMASLDQQEQGGLTVVAEDTLARQVRRIPVDMVVLSVGMEPASGFRELARMTGVATDAEGWFSERHVKLAPVSTPSAGIFLAGCCQGPKDIPDTVAQASAAAGEAVALLSRGWVSTLAEISRIDPDLCAGCGSCVQSCPYSAITYDGQKRVATVNDALCRGCGSCAAACPSGAAEIGHFQRRQVFSEVSALLRGVCTERGGAEEMDGIQEHKGATPPTGGTEQR